MPTPIGELVTVAVEEGFGQPDTGEPQAPQLEGAPRLRDLPVFGYTP